MHHHLTLRPLLVPFLLVFSLWANAGERNQGSPPPTQATGQILVHFEQAMDEPAAIAFANRHGLRFIALAGIDHAALFSCTADESAPATDCRDAVRALLQEPSVRLAYPNRRLDRRPRNPSRIGKSILGDAILERLSQSELILSAMESTDPATIDTPFVVEVALQNRGPATARDIQLSLTPPASFVFHGAIGASCVNGATITCPLDPLAPGERASLQLRLSSPDAGDFTSLLTVASSNTDPRTENNRVSLTSHVQRSASGADIPDLWLALATSPSEATIGETLEYRITLHNRGAGASGASLELLVDNGFSVESLSSGGGACNPQALSCAMEGLAEQESVIVYLRGKPTRAGELGLTAEIASDDGDANPSDNRRTLILTTLERIAWDDPLFSDQWHLYNQNDIWGDENVDINVMPVWQRGLFGEGITLAVVDDGVELGHEDLSANTSAALSWDYNSDDGDPSHNQHGTAVAGLIAARAGNGIGVVGVAPRVTLAGIRAENVTDFEEALALNHRLAEIDIYNNSWGPEDGGTSLEGTGPLTLAALEKGVTQGRGGKGVIYCWAAGNGGIHDNSNFDGYANSRYTLAFGAHSDLGFQAYYSEEGANLMVTAPSDSGFFSITTTDRTGKRGYDNENNYTNTFGGTSAATPIACGVTALMLNANPNLGWRDVHYIIAASAYRIDPNDGDWQANGAGYWVNHKYGFGAIDADAATAMAEQWSNLGSEIHASAGRAPNQGIPDNDPNGISSSVGIDREIHIESVEVTFSASDHPYWGDLRIILTSPDGTESILAPSHDSGQFADYYDEWTFLSKRHLGENARGIWTLKVADMAEDDSGTFESWRLTVYGAAQPPVIPQTAGEVDLQVAGKLADNDAEQASLTLLARNNGPNAAENVILTLAAPDGVDIASLSAAQGSCSLSPTPSCSLGRIPANQEAIISASYFPLPVASIQADISAANPDLNPANNRVDILNAGENEGPEPRQHTVTLAVSGSGMGRILTDDPAQECGDTCRLTLEHGASLTLRASTMNGFSRFDGWLGACQGNDTTCTIIVNDDQMMEARFGLDLPGLFHWTTID